MLRTRTVVMRLLPAGCNREDLQQDPRRSGSEAGWPVGEDDTEIAGVVHRPGR